MYLSIIQNEKSHLVKTVLFHIVLAGKIEEDLVPRGGRRLEQRKHIKSNRVQLLAINYSSFCNQLLRIKSAINV